MQKTQMTAQTATRRATFVACLFTLLLWLLAALLTSAHADGLLPKGDTAHPVSCLVQTASGTLVNGDALVEHITSITTGTTITGTGTFSQPDQANQPGVYAYTRSAADAAADQYGETLFQASDTTTPGNIINPERRTIVAYNPYDPSLLGLTGVATASAQATNTGTLAGMNTLLTTTGVKLLPSEYANTAQAVNTSIVANGLTNRQAAAVNYVYNFGAYTRVKTATQQILTWPAVGSLPGIVSTSSLDSSGNTTGRTSVTFTNLPQ